MPVYESDEYFFFVFLLFRTWRVLAALGFDCSAFVDLFAVVSMPIATFQLNAAALAHPHGVNLRVGVYKH